jgi:hypothetical protein
MFDALAVRFSGRFGKELSRRGATGLMLIVTWSVSCQVVADESIFTGDTVVVVGDQVKLGGRNPPGVSLKRGDRLHVNDVSGEWVGCYAEVNGKRQYIQIRRTDVKLDALPAAAAAPLVMTDKPDEPRALSALKALGVDVELNEKGSVHSADASGSKVADADLTHFSGLYQMTALDLSGCRITDEGAKTLGRLKPLQELYLSDTQITDRGLALLKDLTHLEILALQKTRITGPGLASLKSLQHLLVLNLGQCAVGDDDLQHLQPLPLLEVLAIPGTKVTSAGMQHLRPLAKLRVLNLIGCETFDDAGLQPLRSLGNLRIVHVRGTKVTAEAIEAMGIAFPELAIFE